MIIACPACTTRYVVPDTAIGVDGRTVRCAKCRHSWFQEGPRIEVPETPAPPPPAPPPPAPEPVAAPEPQPPVAEPATVDQSEAEPPISFAEDAVPPPPDSAIPITRADDYDSDYSSFAHEPPFRPRRNPARMWTIAAALFAVVALGAAAAAAWYGLPAWVPFAQSRFAEEQVGLKLDFPDKRQALRQLPDQTWFFEANGTVTNLSQSARSIPPILVVLTDARGREVFMQEITAPKRVLAPGESVAINQALVNVPKATSHSQFGWKPAN